MTPVANSVIKKQFPISTRGNTYGMDINTSVSSRYFQMTFFNTSNLSLDDAITAEWDGANNQLRFRTYVDGTRVKENKITLS